MAKKDNEKDIDVYNRSGAFPENLLDPAVIAKLAGEYFPEFQGSGTEKTPGAGYEPGTGTLSEESLRLIPESLYSDGSSPQAYSEGRAPNTGPGTEPASYGRPGQATRGGRAVQEPASGYIPNSYVPDAPSYSDFPGGIEAYKEGINFVEVPGKNLGARGFGDIPSLVAASEPSLSGFDVNAIRKDFPILSTYVNGRKLIWLDNAATTQKPRSVIDRVSFYYENENSNIHRGAHTLAARSTDAYEAAREKVRRFLNASSTNEIIFVRGATEGINLIAKSYGQKLQKDDEIIITWLEHHANIVPWQMLCSEKGAKLRVVPVDDSGQILLNEYTKLLNHKTKIVSFPHVSNALGTVTPVKEIVELAHRYNAKVVVDGAQAVSHIPVDVQSYGCDFYVFSGHKVFGPTGIGVVYGKYDILSDMPPWEGGGNMISDVTFERTIYQPPPARFEAGTGNIADAAGLGAAIDYVTRIGLHNIYEYEHELLQYATEALRAIPGLRLIGTAPDKTSVLSFVLDQYTTEEVGEALSREGIAVRAGHHCAQPILRRFGLESTVRPSLAFYNTFDEIDALVSAVKRLRAARPSVL
jgi:cysteine desulfurase/selenocysteine lyase